MTTNPFEPLKRHLASVPPGPIADTAEIKRLLADCWADLVDDDGGMEDYKLLDWMEEVFREPPILTRRPLPAR